VKAFFFGCWGEPGHYLFLPGGRIAPREDDERLTRLPNGAHIDGGLAPRISRRDRKVIYVGAFTREERHRVEYGADEAPQGYFLIHHAHGYTYMSWWDRNQGDKRGACNSTFILEGEHNADTMCEKLEEFFPHVVENLRKAEISLRQVV
jgi:hypothetical protein